MFGIGHWEILVVLFLALLLFGKRIPAIARALGRSVSNFKHGLGSGDQKDGLTGSKES
jgi:sec-independent protein translocase protein TatA